MNTPTATRPASSRRPWPLRALGVLGGWLALEVVMVGVAFAWVAVYSYAIAPGRDPSEYEAYAQRVVPWVALAASAPVFGTFAFVCVRRAGAAGRTFARSATLLVVAFDVALFAVSPGVTASAWGILAAATVLKLTGLEAGGRLGARADEARA